jgi:signal-transduction protein with cAMP-binding, CBS, and nucleotidyltransferase domain
MSLANSLKQADIFFELTPTQLELVAALCQERRGKAGDVIFEENAASDELYIIAQGEVDIQVDTYPQLGYRMMRNLAADLALKIRSTDLRIREELLYGQRRR